METAQQVAQRLLQINAIKLSLAQPFTWASGWQSPIYCDNRRALAYPAVRSQLCSAFAALIRAKYSDAEVIAGVATGAIAHGALVADRLGLPFVYVRAKAKEHGLQNRIEGELAPGRRVVVVEDLISTGGSSLSAVAALREAGAEVLGMVAIFSYGFAAAQKSFEQAGCALTTLSGYAALIEQAVALGYVQPSDVAPLQRWRAATEQHFNEQLAKS
ncbi:MAG: orotate phosphoribosyltransferase [Prevotellaceae bacterium]|jgi:orotate phosphoribosyltransferase|nr:orotate phosphoribosyltransferase [Prevotellaceae bacterium]